MKKEKEKRKNLAWLLFSTLASEKKPQASLLVISHSKVLSFIVPCFNENMMRNLPEQVLLSQKPFVTYASHCSIE